jgi:hypothetical protein
MPDIHQLEYRAPSDSNPGRTLRRGSLSRALIYLVLFSVGMVGVFLFGILIQEATQLLIWIFCAMGLGWLVSLVMIIHALLSPIQR